VLQHTGRANTHEYGVSEVIGAVMLIAVVSAAIAVIAVVMLSQPAPEKIPALEAVISNTGNAIQIFHNGGDTLQKEDFQVLVNGAPVPDSVLWPAGSDTTWSSGDTLTFSSPNAQTVQIVYSKGTTASAVLSSANFGGVAGNSTLSLTITAAAGPGGSISPSGVISVPYGGSQAFTITPDDGYRVATVLVDGNSIAVVSTYTFSTVTSSHSIYVTFAKKPVITASAGDHGSISPTGAVIVNYSDSQTFTIIPDTGYHVVDVLVDTSSQGAITSYNFTNVLADHTISATFAINAYSITPSAGANGIISPNTVQMVNYGDSTVFTITPVNSSYRVADVLIDGVSTGPSTSYTFSNVAANHTIAASFALNTYTITAPGSTEWEYLPGWQATYYSDMAWTTVAGTRIDNEIQYANAEANTTFSLHAPTDELNWPVPMVGKFNEFSVTWDGYLLVTGSDTYTFSLTSDDASKLWIDEGLVIDHSGTSPYAPVNGTLALTPGYHHIVVKMYQQYSTAVARLQYSSSTMPLQQVTAWHTSGIVTPPGISTVNYGATPTYAITPNPGYHVADVLVNGTSVGAVTSYVFPAVTMNKTISATFGINTYTITASSGANGAVTPTGSTTVNYGATPTYAITPNPGYHVADVLVNGTSVGAVTSYVFPSVNSDKTISATFAINTYTIAASSGANGVVTPAGTTTVNYGATPTYTITPNPGYHVADVLVNGTSVGAVTGYTFPAVMTNKTISATFAINTYTIAASSGANGAVTPAGTTTVNYGATPTYTITPNPGYHVADVLVNSTSVGAITSYVFPAITTNKTISATFAINTYTITPSIVNGNGTVSPATVQTVEYGNTTSTFTFVPATGYHLNTVTVNGTTVTPTGNSYTFPAVTTNKTIVGTFAINTYTITPSIVNGNGTVSPATVQTVEYGNTTSTFTFVPATGYHLNTVTVNGTTVTPTGNSYTFPAVTTNKTIIGTFAINTYTITPSIVRANGTVSPATVQTVNYGDTPIFTFTPASGYHLNIVTVNGTTVTPTGNSYTFPAVTTNKTINGTFLIDPPVANFTATPLTGGIPLEVTFTDLSTNAPTSWEWNFGYNSTSTSFLQNPTFTYPGPGNYTVRLWATNEGGTNETEKNGYIFTYVAAVADFTADTTVGPRSLNVIFNASASKGTPSSYYWEYGDPYSTTNTSLETDLETSHTYGTAGLYSVNLTVANSYSSSYLYRHDYINVTPHAPNADFFINPQDTGFAPYTVQLNAFSYGFGDPATAWDWDFNDGSAHEYTQSVSHTFTSPGSYNVSVTETNTGGTSTAYNVITVIPLTITASSGPNGNVTPAGSTVVNYGGSQTYAITPIAGYHIANVLVDSVSNGTISSYTFSNAQTNHTISATFAINTYTITASGGANGAITPTGVTAVNYGGSQAYTITPVIKYHIETLVVDGVTTTYPPKITSPYTFSNVQGNHTISVTFAKNLRQEIFFDTFDPITPASNGWTLVSSPDWQTSAPVNGTRSIRFRGSTTNPGPDEAIYRSVPTTGYSEINVSYRLGAQSLDSSSEYFAAQYSTNAGGSYTDITRITGPYTGGTTFTSYTSGAIPTAADNQASNFRVQIGIWASATNDYGWVDDVKVTGIPDYI